MVNPKATEQEVYNAISKANLESTLRDMPKGLDTTIGENGFNLSGGERQRIALAMGLLKKSKILLLDEITSNLDDETEITIKHALERLRKEYNITILAISHRKTILENVSKKLMLSNENDIVSLEVSAGIA